MINSLKCDISKDDELLDRMIDWNLINYDQPREIYEAKLVLMWDKILEICMNQIKTGKQLSVKIYLQRFVKKLIELGKEGSTITRLFAKTSNFSIQFRYLCRVMAAFVSVQVPDNGSVRTGPYAPGHVVCEAPSSARDKSPGGKCSPSSTAQECVKQLQALLTNKQYDRWREQVEEALNVVNDAAQSLTDARAVLEKFSTVIYDPQRYKFLQLLNLRS